MKKKQLPVILILAALLPVCAVSGLYAADVEVTSSISSDKIGTDDVLVYTITFKGINNPQQPSLSHFRDFRVAQTSRGSEFRFINGVSSYYTNFVYYLMPLKTGTLDLPQVSYQHEGKSYKTQPFTVEVVTGSVQPKRPNRPSSPMDMDDDFFSNPFERSRQQQPVDIKLIPQISARSVFKGQQVLFKVLLYTRNRIQGINMLSDQSIPGFWQEWFEIGRSIEGRTETIDGKLYQVYEIRKAALFPTQSGQVTIPALTFDLSLRNTTSLFSDPRRIKRSTKALTISVSDPPPDAAGLPVGRFNFTVKPTKKSIDINDILTLKMQVSGFGNLKTIEVPGFKNSGEIKVYTPKISRRSEFQGNIFYSVIDVEVPVSFKKTGPVTMPRLEFKYFNPTSAAVVSLKSRAITIDVTGQKEKQTSASTVPLTEIIRQGEDIDFIKKGGISDQNSNLYNTRLFLLLLLLPFAFNLLYLLKVLVFDRMIAGSSALKKRKLLNRTLADLKSAREPGDLSPILENYLKEQAGIGFSAINSQSIDKLLAQYGVSDSDITTFIRLKSRSESYRFSPDKDAGHTQLKEDVRMLTGILKRIDSKITK